MKLIYVAGVFALALTFGCNNAPEQQEETKVVERETVRVVEAPAKPAEPVKVQVEEEKGTTVKIGPNGGSVKTKKVDVSYDN